MSVTEYDGVNKVHPANWIGIRVSGWCRDRGLLQAYFNCRGASKKYWQEKRKEAHVLDKRWKNENVARKQKHYNHSHPTDRGNPLTKTSILAIRLDWNVFYENGNMYAYPVFSVQSRGNGIEGKKQTSIRVDETITDAWKRAINIYVQLRNLSPHYARQLRRRPPPTSEDFNKLRLYKRRVLKHPIPKHRVPRDSCKETA